jgi:hypothetical protein
VAGARLCSGEIWTDGRGFACVTLPAAIDGEFGVELRPLTPDVAAALRGDPTPRRFTIETDEPHVKVAWRVTARPPKRHPQPNDPQREET